jgi:hypothetical protein
MATLWQTLQLFTIPLYGICFVVLIELLKYLKVFKSLNSMDLISGAVARELQDQKRVAILIIGALLGTLFVVFNDPDSQFRYIIKILITYSLATTFYENFLNFIKKAWKKFRKKKVNELV